MIELSLRTSKPLSTDNVPGLRGYIAFHFGEDILLHNHVGRELFYSYPRVQYKVTNGITKIIGISEGVKSVKNISFPQELQLRDERISVRQVETVQRGVVLGMDIKGGIYTFLSPWLALNEKNYDKYLRLGSQAKKKKLLEKILVGNILSMSKGLGYTVPAPVEAKIINIKEVQTSLKSNPMLGFLGTFSVNFEIPDYWGIGKSVSRGFGTVKRIDKQ